MDAFYEAAKQLPAGGGCTGGVGAGRGRRSDGNTPAMPATCHASNDAGAPCISRKAAM